MEGQPHKQKVHRVMKDLQKAKLVEQRRDGHDFSRGLRARWKIGGGKLRRFSPTIFACAPQMRGKANLVLRETSPPLLPVK